MVILQPRNGYFCLLCSISLYQSWRLPWCWQPSLCGFPLRRRVSARTSTSIHTRRVCQPWRSLQVRLSQRRHSKRILEKDKRGIPTQAAAWVIKECFKVGFSCPIRGPLQVAGSPRGQPRSPQLRRSRALHLLNVVVKRNKTMFFLNPMQEFCSFS